jgi:plastocyanin
MDRGHRPASPLTPATQPSPTRAMALSPRKWMLVPGLLGALVLQACGAGTETITETGTADCRPAGTELRIKAGEPTHEFSTDCLATPANKPFTIRFTNLDQSSHGQHNIEIEDIFRGETIDGFGKSVTYKIGPQRAGKYKFLCTKHPFMDGTLVVSSEGAAVDPLPGRRADRDRVTRQR